MASIDNLFDLLLEQIFKSLPLFSRLTCKEVCKRWYELLMTRSIFRDDRHIYLKNCVIKPNRQPWTIFLSAKYPYDILTVCENNEELETTAERPLMCPSPVSMESKDFWMHLGTSVTELTFRPGVKDRMYEILPYMPSIRTVTFGNYMLYCSFRSFMASNEKHDQVPVQNRTSLYNIKTVIIEEVTFNERADFIEQLDILLEYIPASVDLIIKKITCESVTQMLPLFESLKLVNLPPQIGTALNKTGEDQQNMERLPSECVSFTIYLEHHSFDQLKTLVDQHPDLHSLHLNITPLTHNQELQIPYSFPQITELSIYGVFKHMQSFKVFEKLENLKSLEFTSHVRYTADGQIFHYFGHDRINLPKLKTLKYNVPCNCEDCNTALANSFPNLTKFVNCTDERVSLKSIQIRSKNWKYLEYMDLRSADFESFADIFEEMSEPRFHLRTLQNWRSINLPKLLILRPEDFTKLSQFFPNLNTIVFGFYQKLDELPGIVEAILTKFKHLTTLQIIGTPKPVNQSTAVVSSIIALLTQHGQKIRVLNLPGKEFVSKELAEKIRECMKNLCAEEPLEEESDQESDDYEYQHFGF